MVVVTADTNIYVSGLAFGGIPLAFLDHARADIVPGDPDDNRILECAVAAGAGFIVTGDNHLLHLGSYRGIRILKVADFMLLPLA